MGHKAKLFSPEIENFSQESRLKNQVFIYNVISIVDWSRGSLSQKKAIRKHMAHVAKQHGFNWFVTVPFLKIKVDGEIHHANYKDIPTLYGCMKKYSNALSIKAFGRCHSDRPPNKWVPMVAIPEYKKRKNDITYLKGENTHPHWHCMVKLPEDKGDELLKFSFDFWREEGFKVCGLPVDLHIQPIYYEEGASNYSTKWLDESVTFEYAIVRGI